MDTTICNFVSENSNIPCFQVELSSSLRKNNLLKLLETLEIIITELARQIEKDNSEYEI